MAYSPKAKLAVIKMHHDGMSLREIEREFGIDRKEIRDWLCNYERDGVKGLERKKYNCTTYEVRCNVIRDYIEGEMTYRQISDKYAICRDQLKKLVAKYRAGGYEAIKEKRRGRPPKISGDDKR